MLSLLAEKLKEKKGIGVLSLGFFVPWGTLEKAKTSFQLFGIVELEFSIFGNCKLHKT